MVAHIIISVCPSARSSGSNTRVLLERRPATAAVSLFLPIPDGGCGTVLRTECRPPGRAILHRHSSKEFP